MRSGLMNGPLWVTSVRIVAIPPLMVFLLVPEIPGARWWAFTIFALACVTDSIDGWLARSAGKVTVAGAFLDTLADKLLISTVLVCLVDTHEVAAWIAMVIIAREFAVTGLRLVAASENVIISAGRFGKAKALSQNVALGAIIVPGIGDTAQDVLLGIALVLTVLSGIHYFLVARWRIFATKPAASHDAMGVDP